MTTLPITPQTHPSLYRKITVGPYDYYARFFTEGLTVGLRENVYDAYREAYKTAKQVEDIDEEQYRAWLATKEGKTRTDCAAMKHLLIPATTETPEFSEELLEWLSQPDMNRALGFFETDFGDKTNGQQASIENSSDAQSSNKTD